MAQLDFSDVLSDIDLIDTMTVISVMRLIGDDGRGFDEDLNPVCNVFAIIVPLDQSLIQQSDGALRDGAIDIYTRFALSGGVKTDDGAGRQPDKVIWHGRHYLVQSVQDWSAFGSGWVHAHANLKQINPTA